MVEQCAVGTLRPFLDRLREALSTDLQPGGILAANRGGGDR
jgi:hypothetical protein